MQLLDHHWINKGCTVEILYGENRKFLVAKIFKVIKMDLTKDQDVNGLNYFIVDVYGEHISYNQTWLKLIEKPGFTRIREGLWVETKTLDNQW